MGPKPSVSLKHRSSSVPEAQAGSVPPKQDIQPAHQLCVQLFLGHCAAFCSFLSSPGTIPPGIQ